MIPPMGQASLGIEIVSSNNRTREIAEFLNDKDSFLMTKLERDFVAKIGAGCSAPVAVNATINNSSVKIESMIGYPNGTNILHKSISAPIDESEKLGNKLAETMIESGALDILKNAEKIAFKDEMPQRI
jgi:hydroxymethylbilane synthase